MIPGLVSITFRRHQPAEIVRAAAGAGLQAIEWGGDVHVPPGKPAIAGQVGQWTRDAGLTVAAYGSYYRAGSAAADADFEAVLETALLLQAPVIRVWAGREGSRQIAATDRTRVVQDLARCADRAGQAGVIVAMEFHDDTINDTATAARELLAEINSPHLRTYWQPPHGVATQDAVAGIRMLAPWLAHVHVFQWWPDPKRRLPLHEGRERWTTFLRELRLVSGDATRAALLEFMPGDSLAELPSEAATLRSLLQAAQDSS